MPFRASSSPLLVPAPALSCGAEAALPVGVAATKQPEETVYTVLADQAFCEQVSRVLLAAEFDELYAAVADTLLYPEALRVHVTQFA